MPFFVTHDSQLGDLAGLAGNVGAYRTQQEDQAAALRAQQVQDQMAHQQAELGVQALTAMLTDRRYRDVAGERVAGQLANTDLHGQYGLQAAQLNQRGRADIASAQIAGANQRAAGHDQTSIKIHNDTVDNQWGMLDERLRSNEGIASMRVENQQKAAQVRADAQRALIGAQAAAKLNPHLYQAAAAHANDLVNYAYRHRQSVARQLDGLRQQLSNLPPFGAAALKQRQQLQGAEQGLMGDLSDAETAYQEAMHSADAIRTGAATQQPPQQQQAPPPAPPAGPGAYGATPPPGYGGALDANGNVPYGMRPPIPQQQPARPMQPQILGQGAGNGLGTGPTSMGGGTPHPSPAGTDAARYATQSPFEQSVTNGREGMQGFDLSTPLSPMGIPGAPSSPAPVRVSSRAEALALPSGTPFIDPNDGQVRVRP